MFCSTRGGVNRISCLVMNRVKLNHVCCVFSRTYSVCDAVVLAGALRRGETLWTAVIGRNPQTLALQRTHIHTQKWNEVKLFLPPWRPTRQWKATRTHSVMVTEYVTSLSAVHSPELLKYIYIHCAAAQLSTCPNWGRKDVREAKGKAARTRCSSGE